MRHACAGDKQTWRGDDRRRPLDPGGIQQADALADALADDSLQRLVASPTKRCMDTLKPLAERLRLRIETTQGLSSDGSIELLLGDRHLMMPGTILCTHGELMKPLLERLRADRVEIDAEYDEDDWLLSKGSAWRLLLDPDGRITKLTHMTPLPLPDCEAHAISD